MTAVGEKPRNILGLIVVALIFGATALMLWMGRARLALIYVAVSLASIIFLFALASNQTLPSGLQKNVTPVDAISSLGFVVAMIALIHALLIRRSATSRPWYSRWFVALPAVPILSLLGAFLVRTLLFQPFDMPGASMAPTLVSGDHFVVSKLAYGYGRHSFDFSLGMGGQELVSCCAFDFSGRVVSSAMPARGDVVVFKLSSDTNIDYIKRVIGLPGDTVQMREGLLLVNGQPVPRRRVEDYHWQSDDSSGAAIAQYEETLPNGVTYRVLDADPNGSADNTQEYIVPDGHFFVMGDNRDNSQDSRYLSLVGYVPAENLVGRQTFRFWQAHD